MVDGSEDGMMTRRGTLKSIGILTAFSTMNWESFRNPITDMKADQKISTKQLELLADDGTITHYFKPIEQQNGQYATEIRHDNTGSFEGASYLWLQDGVSIGRLDPDTGQGYEWLKNFGGRVSMENDQEGKDISIQGMHGGTFTLALGQDYAHGNTNKKFIRLHIPMKDEEKVPVRWHNISRVSVRGGEHRVTAEERPDYWRNYISTAWRDDRSEAIVQTKHDGNRLDQYTLDREGMNVDNRTGTITHSVRSSPPDNPRTGMEVVQDGENWDPAGTGQEEKLCYLNGEWTQVS